MKRSTTWPMLPTEVIMKDRIIDRNSENHIPSNAKPFPSYFTSQVQGHTVSLDQLIPVKEKRRVENFMCHICNGYQEINRIDILVASDIS